MSYDSVFDDKTRRNHAPRESAYQNNIGANKDLFETISEAHYLPDLNADHDEALLESLVEKGCEDNQILGHELSKLADLVTAADQRYAGREAPPGPVVMNRLDRALESTNSNSLSAAQGLLDLQNIGDHLQHPHREPPHCERFLADGMFATGEGGESIDHNVNNINSIVQDIGAEVHGVNVEVNNINIGESNMEEHLNLQDMALNMTYNKIPEDLRKIDIKKHGRKHNIQNNHQNIENGNNDIEPQSHIDSSANNVDSHTDNDNFVEQYNGPYLNNVDNINANNISELTLPEPCLPEMLNNVNSTQFNKNSENGQIINHLPNESDTQTPNNNQSQITNEFQTSVILIETNDRTDGLNSGSTNIDDPKPTDLSMKKKPEQCGSKYSPNKNNDVPVLTPRAPSTESDSVQSPQPSGIPAAAPLSPEALILHRNKQFLDTLFTSMSNSPRMYTDEVSITRHQCEPLNLGKHRKSASPTVTSCTEEVVRKNNRDCGEPAEKRSRNDSTEIHKISNQSHDTVNKTKDSELPTSSESDESSLAQFLRLKNSQEIILPDPLLVPKDKINDILSSPIRAIPALLINRPDLKMDIVKHPEILHDPDIYVITLAELESVLMNNNSNLIDMPKPIFNKANKPEPMSPIPESPPEQNIETTPSRPTPTDSQMGEFDVAAAAAFSHLFWFNQPYMNQMDYMGQPQVSLEALQNYSKHSRGISEMYNRMNRVNGPTASNSLQMEYENRLNMSLWQESLNRMSAKRQKPEHPKPADIQNPYIHSTKSPHRSQQSTPKPGPASHGYASASSQRALAALNSYAQGSYSGALNASTSNAGGIQVPYYNLGGSATSDRRRSYQSTSRSPTTPYFSNNNYLSNAAAAAAKKQPEQSPRVSNTSDGPLRVKPLTNLMDPRTPRRDLETGAGQYPEQMQQPYDLHRVWNPMYNSSQPGLYNWTTVAGD